MKENGKILSKAMIIPAIVTVILAIYSIFSYLSFDKIDALMPLIAYLISLIGLFCFLTLIFYVGLREYRKTKKIVASLRSALYMRAKVRMIILVGTAFFLIFYFLFYYITDLYFPSYSVMISIPLSILFVALAGIFVYRWFVRSAMAREEEWKKLDEDRKEMYKRMEKESKEEKKS